MAELSIPVATLIGAELTHDSIKSLSDSYREFCEDDEEYETTIAPINHDPEPYANGTKKTRPILKKYAQVLLDKIILDQQLEADIHLTPQQVKADMKRYVSICEKKIAKQQEQCDALQKQVEQLMDVVKVLVTYPHLHDINSAIKLDINKKPDLTTLGGKDTRLLAHCAMLDTNSLDYFIEQGIEIESKFYSALHYAIYAKNIKNVKKLLEAGANVNHESYLYIGGSHKLYGIIKHAPLLKYGKQGTPLEVASLVGSLEMVKFLHEKGATIGDTTYHVPNGPEGDLVAGYLQTHGSKPVTRF